MFLFQILIFFLLKQTINEIVAELVLTFKAQSTWFNFAIHFNRNGVTMAVNEN